RGFGRALFVSSVAAFTGGLIGPHYAASKAALAGLVHFYAPRVAPQDVTVNAPAPALIAETGMLPLDPEDPAMAGLVPVGRLGRPGLVRSPVSVGACASLLRGGHRDADGAASRRRCRFDVVARQQLHAGRRLAPHRDGRAGIEPAAADEDPVASGSVDIAGPD